MLLILLLTIFVFIMGTDKWYIIILLLLCLYSLVEDLMYLLINIKNNNVYNIEIMENILRNKISNDELMVKVDEKASDIVLNVITVLAVISILVGIVFGNKYLVYGLIIVACSSIIRKIIRKILIRSYYI